MNEEEVEEIASEHLQPKHFNFSGVKIEADEPNPNSPFKNPNRESPSKGLSAMKQLKLMSGQKADGTISVYE